MPGAPLSNCWIESYKLWRKLGGELVFVKTVRRYYWPCKAPHAFVRLPNGTEVEYVPRKQTLGKYPPPIFKGTWRIRR